MHFAQTELTFPETTMTRFNYRHLTAAAALALAASAPSMASADTFAALQPVLSKNTCLACHAMDRKMVGPSFADIAAKYKGRADAATYLAGKIKSGGVGTWGQIPMPAQASISADETKRVAEWIAKGAAK